ncbi:hypothetical protein ES707_04026 [subsurface metagenome]
MQIEKAAETGFCIGVTAGASTPEEATEEVLALLKDAVR